jgi:ribosomal protein S18 acetylase RimI-like enzyme
VSALIQAYIRRTAANGRETEQIGPFLATFSPGNPNPYANYAVPDPDADPTAADVAALVSAYERRDRIPRLEYLPRLAPAVEKALLAGGFTIEARPPLMTCRRGAETSAPVPEGIELLEPTTDEELHGLLVAQHEGFGDAPPADDSAAGMRRSLAGGLLAVYARVVGTGEPAGGGVCTPISDGVGELAGIATRSRYRRRGIAAAVTARLTGTAFAAGATELFLTPGDDGAERIYGRAGFRTTDEVIFASRRVAAS